MASLFPHWPRRRVQPAPARRTFRPALECLEERLVPAIRVVTSPLDNNGTGTLRSVVKAAGPGDTILVAIQAPYVLHQPIVLTQGEILLNKSLTIGPLPNGLTVLGQTEISGGGNSRIFEISAGVTVTLNSLYLTGGNGQANPNDYSEFSGDGGAILNEGTLIVGSSNISGNHAYDAGGAIYNAGGAEGGGDGGYGGDSKPAQATPVTPGATLTINQSTLNNNTAGYSGGAIFNAAGSEGYGGGGEGGEEASARHQAPAQEIAKPLTAIANSTSGFVTINGGTLSGNQTNAYYSYGGALFNDYAATMIITGVQITSNSASGYDFGGVGGGIYNDGALTIKTSTLSHNYAYDGYYESAEGGAIYNDYAGSASITGSTLSMNGVGTSYQQASGYGGAIFDAEGTVTLTNCTITGNTAAYGGGIYDQFGNVTVSATTITGNTATYAGGGIYLYYGTLTINQKSKVTANHAPNGTDLEEVGAGATISADSTVSLINN